MTASRSLRALSLIAIVALACVALGRGGVAARLGQADPASDAPIVDPAPRPCVDMVACATYDGQTGYLGKANRDT